MKGPCFTLIRSPRRTKWQERYGSASFHTSCYVRYIPQRIEAETCRIGPHLINKDRTAKPIFSIQLYVSPND